MIGKIFFLIATFFTVYILINIKKTHASMEKLTIPTPSAFAYEELASGSTGKVQASITIPAPEPIPEPIPEPRMIDDPNVYNEVRAAQKGRLSVWFDEYRFGTKNTLEQLNRISDGQIQEIFSYGFPISRWCATPELMNCKGEKTLDDFEFIHGQKP